MCYAIVNEGEPYYNGGTSLSITIGSGDVIKLYSSNFGNSMSMGYGGYFGSPVGFGSTAKFNVYGNVASLMYGLNTGQYSGFQLPNYALYGFFGNQPVVSAKNLVIPNITNAGTDAFRFMFYNCQYLTEVTIKAPYYDSSTMGYIFGDILSTGVLYTTNPSSWTSYVPSTWTITAI